MKSVSVIVATFNAGEVFGEYLKSIRGQDYNQRKVEIVVADGGSTDQTLELAKKYNCKVILEKTGSPEGAKSVALKAAKGDLILIGDSDNIWPYKTWLKKMVQGLDKASGALGVYSWRYTHRKKDSLMNRYFSLFGANDPLVWFLKKTDRQSYLSDEWMLKGKLIEEARDYFVVEYATDDLPTVGANGFLIRQKDLLEAKVGEKDYFHIDVILDLVKKRPRRFVVLKTDVIHKTGDGCFSFLKKRSRYMRELYLRDNSRRRYFVYQLGKDEVKTIWYSLYSLSLVLPLVDSFKGYLKKKDWAWFMHPVMCFLMFWTYFLVVLRHLLEVKILRKT